MFDVCTTGDTVNSDKIFKFFNMLTRVWQEPEYRIDVCRVARGAHIENL